MPVKNEERFVAPTLDAAVAEGLLPTWADCVALDAKLRSA